MKQSLLQLHFAPFDPSLLEIFNSTLCYDGSGYDSRFDFLNSLLCENAWACGCGQPEEAADFFYKQFLAIPDNIDYHVITGGFDLFKYACWKKGLVNGDMSYTGKGQELIDMLKLIALTPEDLNTKMTTKVSLPDDITAQADLVGQAIATVFGDVNGLEKVNYVYALLYVGILGDFLHQRHLTEYGHPRYEQLFELKEKVFKDHEGEHYNSFHLLENVLDMEEHGGSTPGWLTAEPGVYYQHAINKLFSNNNTLFEYCLK